MSDYAHVQTKIRQSLAESRDLSIVLVQNPTSSLISQYRTAIDPALVQGKVLPVDSRVIDLDGDSVPAWLSHYRTGLSAAEVWYKTVLSAGGSREILVGDGPWVHDVGPVVNLPQPTDHGIYDWWHKNVVTDLAPDDIIIEAGTQFSNLPYFSYGVHDAQSILFPSSSRHLVKTSDGVLHAVASYTVSGLHRIVYLRSSNGGETWSSTLVDNGDGMDYVSPSITCDKNNGIHITFTRWDGANGYTYWLWDGSGTPTGFDLVSTSSDTVWTDHVLTGGEAVYGGNDYHAHSAWWSEGSGDPCYATYLYWRGHSLAYCGHYHDAECSFGSGHHLPPCRTLKMLGYPGIPPTLPAGIILPFVTSVPSGFTRYSEQDGKYIRLSNVAGTLLGSTQHRHLVVITTSNDDDCNNHRTAGEDPGSKTCQCPHKHDDTTGYTGYKNNFPPSYNIVLGKLNADSTIIPANSILMSIIDFSLSILTSLSKSGETLYNKCLIGNSSYSDAGGNSLHNHPDFGFYLGDANVSGDYSIGTGWPGGGDSGVSWLPHYHTIDITNIGDSSLYPAYVAPRMSKVDSAIDCTKYGNDLFYTYLPFGGVWTTPVNVSQIYKYFPSFQGVCLADNSDDVHVLWSGQGINPTNPGRGTICYKKKSSGTWGSRTDITSADLHHLDPSIDIDKNNDIHIAWFEATNYKKIQYRKYSGGSWGSIEDVDTSSYVGFPGNLIVDSLLNVHLTYLTFADAVTQIREVLYKKRTGAGWGSATNLSPGKAAGGYQQFSGQCAVDNNGNVLATWQGKGYGSHALKYHPVYRTILTDGTIVPSVGSDAVDLFPSDDAEIIMPCIFWHAYPYIDGVYHNTPVSGASMIYLYDIRGVGEDTADLCFYSMDNALVGDVGNRGIGGSGAGGGGISGEGVFQQTSYSIGVRGHICRSSMVTVPSGRYV